LTLSYLLSIDPSVFLIDPSIFVFGFSIDVRILILFYPYLKLENLIENFGVQTMDFLIPRLTPT
jgi:hypothetical protein